MLLATYQDPGLEIPGDETLEHIGQVETERLIANMALAHTASLIPRRLGTMDRKAMAREKKICRRIEYAEEQTWRLWGSLGAVAVLKPEELKRQAAIVRWEDWGADQSTYLLNRMVYVATYAVKHPEAVERTCKRAMMILNDERRWLAYALR